MGGNHTILTIAAILLFSIIALNTSRNIMYSSERSLQAEYISSAVSLGQKLIKVISSKSFDQSCVAGEPEAESDFSLSLGAEYGEDSLANYNDVDDFNGFSISVNNDYTGTYILESTIDYVSVANPTQISANRTRLKRITVRVFPDIIETATFTKDTVLLYYYSSY